MRLRTRILAFAGVAGAALAAGAIAGAATDFGQGVERDLKARSYGEFGVRTTLPASSTLSITAGEANADPKKLGTFVHLLQVRVVTSGVAGANTDMLALWPDDTTPTHLITCNEQGAADPGVQRVNIATGAVDTIVTGTVACDGIRRTQWGTILFTEEAGGGPNGGRAYELIDPLNTTGVSLNRATGVFSGGTGAANIVVRPAMGRLSFEGLAVYPNGVIYFGDESRPNNGTGGGAYFKFIPTTPRAVNAPAITNLSQSPMASGNIYGLRLGKRSGNTDYGQGSEIGLGTWITVCTSCADPDLRAQAATLKLTGYYRPEDIDIDLEAAAVGNVRFCAPNTGNEEADHNWGEVICITDGALADAVANVATPEVTRFVQGNPQFAMPDNIAFHPLRSTWLVMEDGDQLTGNNDIWACLPDGLDADVMSDGCIRIATLNDLNAEWTGGIFDATGKRFFVSVQHNVTGKGVIYEVTGWR